MNSIRPVQWGFAGTGSISATMASQIAGSPHARAVAVSSRSLDSAQNFAATHTASKKPARPSMNCLPMPMSRLSISPCLIALHRSAVLAALDAGKHVLCEKPLALNAAEVAEIAAHPRAQSLMVTEGFMLRYQPQWEWIEARIAAGALGTLKHVSAFTAVQFPPPKPRR